MLRDAAADTEPTAGALDIRVLTSLREAEPLWRRLEAEAVLSPYQRFDWVAALETARGRDKGRLTIGIVQLDHAPVALLALDVARKAGLAVAKPVGADIANTGWVMTSAAFAPQLSPALLQRLLTQMAKPVGGIDVFQLYAQPKNWLGVDNPLLALPHQLGPDSFYFSSFAGDGPLSRLNTKRVRNITRAKRRLEELFGPVSLRTATTPDEIDRVHQAFLKQRGQRFQQMGVRNVFADSWFVRFFSEAAVNSLGDARPALQFHALYGGDEILATSCGTYVGNHFSQYINATADGQAAKYSLMGLMLYELLPELARDGITSFDIGLGDFDYKTDWSDPQDVYDAVIPVTALGRLAAPAMRRLRALKRTVKHNKTLYEGLKRLRALTLKKDKPEAAE